MFATAHAYAFVLLTGTSVAYQLIFRRWERLRRAVSNNHAPDMLSVWTFAAVMVLPLWWMVAAIGCYYIADWNPRSTGQGPAWVQRGKFLYSIGTVEAGAVVSSYLVHTFPGMGVVAGVPAQVTVNALLVAAAVIASGKRSRLPTLLRPQVLARWRSPGRRSARLSE